jgi:hypothetical protein
MFSFLQPFSSLLASIFKKYQKGKTKFPKTQLGYKKMQYFTAKMFQINPTIKRETHFFSFFVDNSILPFFPTDLNKICCLFIPQLNFFAKSNFACFFSTVWEQNLTAPKTAQQRENAYYQHVLHVTE